MSQTLVQRPTHVHNFPSSREIIDVDDLVPGSAHVHLDDDDIQLIEARPSRGSNRLSHEPIVIADSDDDIEIVSGPSRPRPPHNGRPERNQQIHRPNRRVLFSPSPPPQDNYVPPVPPLPPLPPFPGLARDQPPLRYRPPPDVDLRGVVRPMEQPFGFEQGLQAQPRLPPVRDVLGQENLGARPNAADRPNIALGGGMLALNRRNLFDAAHPVPSRADNNGGWRGILGGFGLAAYRMFFQPADGGSQPMVRDMDDDRDLLEALALDAEERQQDHRFRLIHRPFARRHAHQQHQQPEEPKYKPTFTHPAKPEPDFSNDFASQAVITISDGPGPSSTHETGTVLVCAMCLDPLVMNVVGAEEEMHKRKLFALRCGHILDGKCIDSIMMPPNTSDRKEDQDLDEGLASSSGKGKGKAKAENAESLNMEIGEPSSPIRRSKGKQKAVDTGEDGSVSIPVKREAPSSEDYAGPAAHTRYRLRPRHGDPGPASSSAVAGTSSIDPIPTITSDGQLANAIIPTIDPPPHPNTRSRRYGNRSMPLLDPVLHGPTIHSVDYAVQSAAARRRPGRPRGRATKGRARGKGKGKVLAPVIEAEHEWACPVVSCGHKHKSVRIEGVWRMDEQQGAIAMYV